jgi:hypothetical protein
MTPQDWLGTIFTTLSIVAFVAGMVKWYIGTQIKPIHDAVEDIRSETKTNGGTSMRDEIKAIKRHNEEAKELRKATSDKLDRMYEILLKHIENSNK